ncbi:hypothetical protein AUJ65_04530 [Candidatus Micrarchaeota archaeon CG1_02_51_15]|nr:MAG: hypothetical protein AUJ65_04530 [Candidatus Micrarchaeota archaeon CG1_02_51_15]
MKPRLLLVSYDIDDEAKRLADFLREACNLPVSCVNFDYYSNEDREIFVPKSIGEEYVEELEQKEWSQTEKAYCAFFEDIATKFKERNPGRTDRKVTHASWMDISSGISGLKKTHLEWEFRGRGSKNKEFWVSIHFEHMKKGREQNKKIYEIFKKLEEKTKLFEKELGITPEIRFEEWRAVIGVKRDVGSLEAADNPETKKWAVETMTKLDTAWKKALKQLDFVDDNFQLTTAGRIALL